MDVAHRLAEEGAAPGTLVLADVQTAGRGRAGRRWTSEGGQGVWITAIERPADVQAVGVLALRVGLHAARALDPLADGSVQLKWPNDLHLASGKLAGILIETRWRAGVPEWVAIGFGLNVRPPRDAGADVRAAGLRAGVSRTAALERLVPAVRDAAQMRGLLSDEERAAFDERHLAHRRRVAEPVPGEVVGIAPDGALLVRDESDVVAPVRAGSLVLA